MTMLARHASLPRNPKNMTLPGASDRVLVDNWDFAPTSLPTSPLGLAYYGGYGAAQRDDDSTDSSLLVGGTKRNGSSDCGFFDHVVLSPLTSATSTSLESESTQTNTPAFPPWAQLEHVIRRHDLTRDPCFLDAEFQQGA